MDFDKKPSDPNDSIILKKILKGETDYILSPSDSNSDDAVKFTCAPKQYKQYIDLVT